VPFFFKQWDGVRKKRTGWELDGRTYDDYPERAQADVLSEGERLAAARAIRAAFETPLPVLGD
jgi:hypothetical protein